jgi:hypothetical protein
MNGSHSIRVALIIGWVIVSIAVVIIAVILVPEPSRSVYFWHRVVWTEVLALLSWGAIGLLFVAPQSRGHGHPGIGGIAPTVGIVVGGYAFLSFAAMQLNAFASDHLADSLHLGIQVLIFVVASTILVFTSIARASQHPGSNSSGDAFVPPQRLCAQLAQCEDALRAIDSSEPIDRLTAMLKSLREAIQYSVPTSQRLGGMPEYRELSDGVGEVVALTKGCKSGAAAAEQLPTVSDRVARMVSLVGLIGAQSKVAA